MWDIRKTTFGDGAAGATWRALRQAMGRAARLFGLAAAALLGAGITAAFAAQTMTIGEARSGNLLLKAVEEGRYVPAPLVGADVDITVSGPTARSRVTQHFYNPTDGWIEGVYVFPMPENAAVDTLRMVVGGRVIIGEIQERQKAKEIYEAAKREGKKAGLLEQERPNIFTNSVANIGPGETVVIQIEYQESVRQKDGQFSLRVPLVVAPRFNPEPVLQTVDLGGEGWGRVSDPVPDRDRIEPPVLDPRQHPPVNPVTLTARVTPGFPIGEVKSHHHVVKLESDARGFEVKLDGAVPADKDFELTWQAANGAAPQAGLFREQVAGKDYVLAFVTPPLLPPAAVKSGRDIVFVIDNSGSMGGASITQAKDSLLYALGRLAPADRFNLVRFDDTMDELFSGLVPADAAHISRAKAFVAALEASGGTVMVPAMRAALVDTAADPSRLRQVVFLTDGAIGNEKELFETLAAGLGRSRVFMVGIGSAPNSHLMTRAAEIGRGSFTHIGSAAQLEERMRALFEKLEKPAVTNLTVKFSEGGADVTPKVLPDLYAGEPLTIVAKLPALSGTVEISGLVGDRPWSATLPVAKAAEGKGLSKLWARAHISDAEVGAILGATSQAEADRRILALALEHSLLSRLTSLVAVDKTPSRLADVALTRADVPLNLPAGWDFDKVFGETRRQQPAGAPPQPGPDAVPAPKLQDAALIQKIAAARHPTAAVMKPGQPVHKVVLPATATDAASLLRAGLLLLLASLVLLLVAFRRRAAHTA
jgi:Ca-activated chloride channel family protein